MKILTLPVGQMGTNCYLIEDQGEVGIIDPGDDGDFIIRKITDLEAKPIWVASTHGHFDHVLAVSELCLSFNIPFYLNPKDNFLLKKAKSNAEYFLGFAPDPILVSPLPLISIKDLKLGKLEFKILETPGHTPGSVCLYCKKEKVLFGGDLIFDEGEIGRTDFKYSSKNNLQKSIKKILKLPESTIIYPGHGKELTIKEATKKLARSEFS